MSQAATTDIADVVVLIQELEIDDSTRSRLIESVTTNGLTEPVKREIQAILVQHIDRDYQALSAYQKVEDLLTERDAKLATIEKETEQALNRVAMQTDAKLERLERKIDEDVDAAKGGATLLLHTEDIAPAEPSRASSPSATTMPSPKEAARIVVAAASATAQPESRPREDVPATLAPLPPTPIAPPVTEPSS